MNVYICLSQELTYKNYDYDQPDEDGACWAMIAAETHSKAKYLLYREAEHDFKVDGLKYFGASIRIYCRNITDLKAGVMADGDPIYDAYCAEQDRQVEIHYAAVMEVQP